MENGACIIAATGWAFEDPPQYALSSPRDGAIWTGPHLLQHVQSKQHPVSPMGCHFGENTSQPEGPNTAELNGCLDVAPIPPSPPLPPSFVFLLQ